MTNRGLNRPGFPDGLFVRVVPSSIDADRPPILALPTGNSEQTITATTSPFSAFNQCGEATAGRGA